MHRFFFNGALAALIIAAVGLYGLFGHIYVLCLIALGFSIVSLGYSFWRVSKAHYRGEFKKDTLFVDRESSFFWLGALVGSMLSPALILGILASFIKRSF